MKRPAHYQTKQRDMILSGLSALEGGHVSAGQLAGYLQSRNSHIGLTTIYRHLDKLVTEGRVEKYVVDGLPGAYYRYTQTDETDEHFHLKCEVCGKLVYVECAFSAEIENHIAGSHGFRVNTGKTVFYGACVSCAD